MSDTRVSMPWSGGGHLAQDRATSVVPAPLRASYLCPELAANAKALCAHCSQPHGQAGGRAGREQPARHRSQANGLGGLCSEPPFPHHTRLTVPRAGSWTRAPAPRCPPAPRPREDPTLPAAPCAPHPAPLLALRQTCSPAGSSALGRGQG